MKVSESWGTQDLRTASEVKRPDKVTKGIRQGTAEENQDHGVPWVRASTETNCGGILTGANMQVLC